MPRRVEAPAFPAVRLRAAALRGLPGLRCPAGAGTPCGRWPSRGPVSAPGLGDALGAPSPHLAMIRCPRSSAGLGSAFDIILHQTHCLESNCPRFRVPCVCPPVKLVCPRVFKGVTNHPVNRLWAVSSASQFRKVSYVMVPLSGIAGGLCGAAFCLIETQRFVSRIRCMCEINTAAVSKGLLWGWAGVVFHTNSSSWI